MLVKGIIRNIWLRLTLNWYGRCVQFYAYIIKNSCLDKDIFLKDQKENN